MTAFAHYPSLEGRSVFISGGTTGIGTAFVEHFHAQGRPGRLRRAATGRRPTPCWPGIAARPNPYGAPTPLFIPCDVTDIGALKAAIDQTRRAFGPIGALVNNAANDQRHQVETVTPEFWDQCMNVNLRHQFFAAQAVVDDMVGLGGGSIINLGSISWMIKGAGLPGLRDHQGGDPRADALAGQGPGQAQHPRQRAGAGLGDDGQAAQDVGDTRVREGHRRQPVPAGAASVGRHRDDGALPRGGRLEDVHGTELRGGCRVVLTQAAQFSR